MDSPGRRKLANDWLKHLSLALKNVGLYSATHPRGREAVDRAYESLARLMEERGEALLAHADGRLSLDQIVLERDRGLAQQLQSELMSRGIDDIVFHSALAPGEHLRVIHLLLMTADQVAAKGGLGQILLDEGISSVKVNTRRGSRTRDSRESGLLGELALMDFLTRLENPGGEASAQVAGMPSATAVLANDPIALAGAILARAKALGPGAASSPEILAETLVIALERLAERALLEKTSSREAILTDLGRAVVGSDPVIHPPLFLETAGPGSIHQNVAQAVETLSPAALGELAAIHTSRAGSDFRLLHGMLNRTSAWRNDRASALAAMEQRVGRDLMARLMSDEAGSGQLLGLLQKDPALWRIDFDRLREALTDLLAADKTKETAELIGKYLGGLELEESSIRRRVADNCRPLVQFLDKHAGGRPMLGAIAQNLLARFEDEKDTEIAGRLATGITAVADARLRAGELRGVLDLLNQAERLRNSPNPSLKERGEKLFEAFSRLGEEDSLASVIELALEGRPEERQSAREILAKTGAGHLIERLATEQSRSHRAQLVMLLKEIGKTSPGILLPHLADSRWFLVRNLVTILGDIGNAGTVPHLEKAATHADPKVRREAIRSLMRLGTTACEDVIVRALDDEDSAVQIAAVTALASLKSRRALKVLLEVAKGSGKDEAISPDVRLETILALGRLGVAELVPVLAEILSRKAFLGYTESKEMRVAAAKALGGIHTAEATELLEDIADHDPRQGVREAARAGLQQRMALK
jgi:HEAT repeat protein